MHCSAGNCPVKNAISSEIAHYCLNLFQFQIKYEIKKKKKHSAGAHVWALSGVFSGADTDSALVWNWDQALQADDLFNRACVGGES